MANPTEQRAAKKGLLPLILILAGFFVFAGVVAFTWSEIRPDTIAWGGRSPEERIQILREQREREREQLTEYGWVDREEGIVRLPVERGMELVLEELNQEQEQN